MVRLSGTDAFVIGQRVFRSSPLLGERLRHVEFGRLIAKDGAEIDTGLGWALKGPGTYTGEDTVELTCHGSQAVLALVVESAVEGGATGAQPGEFTRRAFVNGRLDLVQVEAVIDLIQAGSRSGLDAAYGQGNGRLSSMVRDLKEETVKALATIEAALDFSEEDIDEMDRAALDDTLSRVVGEGRRLIETFEGHRLRQKGPKIALVGRPNAGKSTLFNALLGEDRAIVTPEPGTTRDPVEGITTWRGETVRLFDTAGIREARGPVEREGVERARAAALTADLVIVVVDAAQPLDDDDRSAIDTLTTKEGILVLNKCDLLHGTAELNAETRGQPRVLVSALHGRGLSELRSRTMDQLPRPSLIDGVGLTRERHRECLARAIKHADTARALSAQGQPEECLAAELQGALRALGELLGESVSEDVLDRIFADFCIGK